MFDRDQRFIDIEFHLSTAAETPTIIAVVFRLDSMSGQPAHIFGQGWDDLDAVDCTLSQLPGLQYVIVETPNLSDGGPFASGFVRVRDRIRRRSCAVSRQLALGVQDGTQPFVVSPLGDDFPANFTEHW